MYWQIDGKTNLSISVHRFEMLLNRAWTKCLVIQFKCCCCCCGFVSMSFSLSLCMVVCPVNWLCSAFFSVMCAFAMSNQRQFPQLFRRYSFMRSFSLSLSSFLWLRKQISRHIQTHAMCIYTRAHIFICLFIYWDVHFYFYFLFFRLNVSISFSSVWDDNNIYAWR